MSFITPLSFRPLFMERVWGGHRLAEMPGKGAPAGAPIGESWELVDREDAQSVVARGPFIGTTLHELWTVFRKDVFGARVPDSPRFPLLAKILDAQETLSVQVHPPVHKAADLKGDPKTEMWYLLDTAKDAELFAGFRRGTTRAGFEHALAEGRAAELLHRVPVRAGDAMFIPSGCCHAIGAGCLIVEIQQNSDTTYRVFDWNRTGLDGKPRALHVTESLASIDFKDHEPALAQASGETIVSCAEFHVERWQLAAPRTDTSADGVIFTVLSGSVGCAGEKFACGEFFILPATARDRTLSPIAPDTSLLRTTIPHR
ncbi:MAG: type I phosphomannose isomerase catalytic subunit [Chthoniobacteraceae bacterium]